MSKKSVIKHPLVSVKGIIGFQGYGCDSLFTVPANGDNNFLLYGIAENSLLVVDQSYPYKKNKLNVFAIGICANGEKQLKLSLDWMEKSPYVGRVIMSVNQFE